MPPRLNVPTYRDLVKRCNFHKADWKRFCFLTVKSVERLPPPDTTKIEKAYQELYESPLSTAKQCITLGRGKNYVPCRDIECKALYRSFLRAPMETGSDRAASSILHAWTIRSRSDGKKLSIPSTSRTPAARRGAPSTNFIKRPPSAVFLFTAMVNNNLDKRINPSGQLFSNDTSCPLPIFTASCSFTISGEITPVKTLTKSEG